MAKNKKAYFDIHVDVEMVASAIRYLYAFLIGVCVGIGIIEVIFLMTR